VYDLRTQYFDEEDGISKFELFVNRTQTDRWQGDNHLPTPTTVPDAHSSIRRTTANVKLRAGDEIRLVGMADAGERAVVDYFEIVPDRDSKSTILPQSQ
jgi:hypothetical protein